MAASMPISYNSQIPVTPPPDHQMFMKGLPPQFHNPFSHLNHLTPPTTTASATTAKTTTSTNTGGILKPAEKPINTQPSHHHHPQFPPPNTTTSKPASETACPLPHAPAPHFPAGIDSPTAAASAAVDPRYVAMASRIASYYQQRCQAVVNSQHQRCQQWATAQRAKCQEMTQAAMLIVAWYIRDRIQRRRRKQKRGFKRGLRKKELLQQKERGKGIMTKGETVRRWVMTVPISGEKVEEPRRRDEVPIDSEERGFDVDMVHDHDRGKGGQEDKDNQLFQVANNLIKSQLARIDVPMLGVLNFDESESESEESEEEEDDDEEMAEEQEEEDEGEDYEEEDYEYDDDEEEGSYEEEAKVEGKSEGKDQEMTSVSKDAQLGTTTEGSRGDSGSHFS